MNDYFLLTNSVGTIQAGPDQQERLDELTERLHGGEFYIPTIETIPIRCIDGRVGTLSPAPNTAGGSETFMVADDLTFKNHANETTLESYSNILTVLQTKGLPIGGHTDEHALDSASGCGANDKLEMIYGFIAEHGDPLRELTSSLSVAVSDETHHTIITNASARTEFSPGSELLTVLLTAGGEDVVDVLQGSHKEVVAVINTVAGTTLNRSALEAEFGAEYEAFNLDVWALLNGAATIATDESQVPALVTAAVYYNLATAHILCGPTMRVIVRTS